MLFLFFAKRVGDRRIKLKQKLDAALTERRSLTVSKHPYSKGF